MKKILGILSVLVLTVGFVPQIRAEGQDLAKAEEEIEVRALQQLIAQRNNLVVTNSKDVAGAKNAKALKNYTAKGLSYALASELNQKTIACPGDVAKGSVCVERNSLHTSCYLEDVEKTYQEDLPKALKDVKNGESADVTAEYGCRLVKTTVGLALAPDEKQTPTALYNEESDNQLEFNVIATAKLKVQRQEVKKDDSDEDKKDRANAELNSISSIEVKEVKLANNNVRLGVVKDEAKK